MDIFKRDIAPVSEQAWKEINEQTQKVLDNFLITRKFVDIDGPNGIDFGAVSTGRLTIPPNQPIDGVNYGIRQVVPLIEARMPFQLDNWELDSISRGAMDADLDALDTAAKEMARFEEDIVFNGLEKDGIKGLTNSSKYDPVELPENVANILKFVGAQINRLHRNAVEGPYTLIIAEDYWLDLINLNNGYPIIKQLEELLTGQIIVNTNSSNSYLVSERGGDFELVIGQDNAVGYQSHDSEKVNLFITGSFTFRVLGPEAVVVLKSKSN
jgi:uncharacterized linocin/CFP29 family protein